jgi:NADPH-dependent F420 reductase
MKTKQTIAVIGATGKMGSGIARNLSQGDYKLLINARDQEKLDSLLQEIKKSNPSANVEIVDSSTQAAAKADVVILAVPYSTEKALAEKIRKETSQKIVVSISNPLNSTYNGMLTSPDTSAAEELQKLLPDAKVIKAFNTSYAAGFATPVIGGKLSDGFIAGNDETALKTISEVVSAAGFNPIVAGELPFSRTLENMTLLLIQLTMKYNYNWLAGWKVLHN